MFLKEARAAERFFNFFTSNIQNKHTRRAYYDAACKFSEFCADRGVHDLTYVKPVDVEGYIESLREGFAKPTIKQHLAAARVGAVLQMKVRDYFSQGRRGWERLHEKGGSGLVSFISGDDIRELSLRDG